MYSFLSAACVAAMCSAATVGSALAQEVAPDFYQEPGIQKNRAYVNQHFNEHIDPFTGALQLHYVDVRVPGNGGFDIEVVRSYNSTSVDPMNPAAYSNVAGPLAGLGWTVHFGRVLKKTTNFTDLCSNLNTLTVADNPSVELPDGSRQLLAWVPGATASSSPMAITAQRWRADCAPGAAGAGMVVFSPSGVRYEMTHRVSVGLGATSIWAWYTKRIVDRNGNSADINYAAPNSPEISSVTTSDGRTISFSYFDSGNPSRRIASITAHGATYTYGYDSLPGMAGVYQLTSVTRPGGTKWLYEYNGSIPGLAGSFMMKKLTNPEGGSLSYTYKFVLFDPVSNPAWGTSTVFTKTASSGGSWSYNFSPGSFGVHDKTTVVTPSGTLVYRHFGPNFDSTSNNLWKIGLLVSKQDGSARSETLTWDKQKISNETFLKAGRFGLMADFNQTNAPILVQRNITQDGQSYTTSYSGFDAYGNPGTVTENGANGGSRTTSLTYAVNTGKWIVNQVKDESYPGSSTTRSFDGNGNLTAISRDGVSTSYGYDGQGNISSATFPRSLTHSYSNHKRGIAQSESQPEGISISRAVSDAGNVTSETNGDGFTSSYGYDGLNRVTSIGYPTGNGVSISYGSNSKTVTRGALIEATTYDGFGYPVSVTLGGVGRTFKVDALGRRTFESNPDAASGTNFQYDTLNRVTKIINADGSSSSIAYGPANKKVFDERGKVSTYTFRAYGNPDQQVLMGIAAADPSASVSIGRNSRDLVSSVTQAGLTRNYGYNGSYHLTSVSNPETGSTVYGRDAAGNMTSRSVGASGTTSYGYDGQNRLTSVTYPGSTPSVTNTYNKRHKLLSAKSSGGDRTFLYDSNGNLTSETLSVDGLGFTAGYAYNGNDQLTAITYPRSSSVVNYAPDVLGRPTQVSGFVTSVSYWPSGQAKQINYANGTVTSYNQNSRLWPSTFATQKGGTTYVNSSYSYDGAGNLTGISDAVDTSYNRTLGYDNINRLTTVNGPWGGGSIAYNGAGNITSQVLGSSSIYYSYDGNNRLGSVSGSKSATYGYDAYGNVTSAAGNAYTYDGVPNMRCVNCADPVNKIEYGYDALNQRATVTKAGVKSYEMVGSNGLQLVEFTPGAGNKLVEYIYLGGKRVAQREPSAGTVVVLTASPNPAAVNKPVTLTAAVTGNSPTGTVTFKDGATTLGSGTLTAGKAIYTHTFTATGTRTLTAVYAGDGSNPGATSAPVSLVVALKATSTTALTVTPNPAEVGKNTVLTATITGGSPTGTVVFKDGGTPLGTATVTAGKATLNHKFASMGSKSISASYGGDASNTASDSGVVSVTVTAAKLPTTMTLTASPNPALVNEPVTLTASVKGSSPTGTVTFLAGANILGTATLSAGEATYTATFATSGDYALKAEYSGDAVNSGSSSVMSGADNTGLLLHFDGASSGISFAFTDASQAARSPQTLTPPVKADPATPKFGLSSMNFTGGGILYSSSPAWEMDGNDFTVETWARFNDDATGARAVLFGQSDASGNKGTFELSKTAGNSLRMQITTSDGVFTQTGSSVAANTWYHLALVRAGDTLTLYRNGVVDMTMAVTGLVPARATAFGVGIAGEAAPVYGGATGNTMMGWLDEFRVVKGEAVYTAPFDVPTQPFAVATVLRVNGLPAGVTLFAAPNPGAVGKPITLTATVVGSSPTGTVVFKDGATVLGSAPLVTGVANLDVTFASDATRSITAEYSGDAANPAKTSAVLTLKLTDTSKLIYQVPSAGYVNVPGRSRAIIANSSWTENKPAKTAATGTVTFYENGNLIAVKPVVQLFLGCTMGSATSCITSPYAPVGNNGKINALSSSQGGDTRRRPANTIGYIAPNWRIFGYGADMDFLYTSTGKRTLTAVYSGDANYPASTSLVYVVDIGVATSVTTLASSKAVVNPGESVVLTATVDAKSPLNIAPQGSVSFYEGSNLLGTVPLVKAPPTYYNSYPNRMAASWTGSFPAVARHQVKAVYSGDPVFQPSDSPKAYQRVYQTAVNLPAAVLLGTPTTFKVDINAAFPVSEINLFNNFGTNHYKVAGGPAPGGSYSGSYTYTSYGGMELLIQAHVTEPEGDYYWNLGYFQHEVVGMEFRKPPMADLGVEWGLNFPVELKLSTPAFVGKTAGTLEVFDNGTLVQTVSLKTETQCNEWKSYVSVFFPYPSIYYQDFWPATYCGSTKLPNPGSRTLQFKYTPVSGGPSTSISTVVDAK